VCVNECACVRTWACFCQDDKHNKYTDVFVNNRSTDRTWQWAQSNTFCVWLVHLLLIWLMRCYVLIQTHIHKPLRILERALPHEDRIPPRRHLFSVVVILTIIFGGKFMIVFIFFLIQNFLRLWTGICKTVSHDCVTKVQGEDPDTPGYLRGDRVRLGRRWSRIVGASPLDRSRWSPGTVHNDSPISV